MGKPPRAQLACGGRPQLETFGGTIPESSSRTCPAPSLFPGHPNFPYPNPHQKAELRKKAPNSASQEPTRADISVCPAQAPSTGVLQTGPKTPKNWFIPSEVGSWCLKHQRFYFFPLPFFFFYLNLSLFDPFLSCFNICGCSQSRHSKSWSTSLPTQEASVILGAPAREPCWVPPMLHRGCSDHEKWGK